MIFTETRLKGAYVVQIQKIIDERGSFGRSWCQREFAEHGLNPSIIQMNVASNHRRGTLRGMHYQLAPYAEAKYIRCTRGAIYDVIIDLRAGSPTYGESQGLELTPENGRMIYAPEGFAHGYQTLEDDTEICYMTSFAYAPAAARGVRYDNPAFGIHWPLPVSVISAADQAWPDFPSRDIVPDVCGRDIVPDVLSKQGSAQDAGNGVPTKEIQP